MGKRPFPKFDGSVSGGHRQNTLKSPFCRRAIEFGFRSANLPVRCFN
jgi:hypothetical protein